MSKFCAYCGTQLADEDLFCSACGAPAAEHPPDAPVSPAVPADPPAYHPGPVPPQAEQSPPAPASSEPDWMNDGEMEYHQPTAPVQAAPAASQKKLNRGTVAAIIVVLVLAAAAVTASLILRALNTPDHTAEQFLNAMETGDFSGLAAVAQPADEALTLTEENTAPLFLLYQNNEAFRESVKACLDGEILRLEEKEDKAEEEKLFSIGASDHFHFYTSYQVLIGSCSAEIFSDLACMVEVDQDHMVRITMPGDSPYAVSPDTEYFPDYHELLIYGVNTVRSLLPGEYVLRGTVSNSLGQTFSGTGKLEICSLKGAEADVDFDYQLTRIQNKSAVPVSLSVNGEEIGTIPENTSYMLGPVSPDTIVEATAALDGSPSRTQFFRADDDSGYAELSFKVVQNSSTLDMKLLVDGKEYASISPGASCLTGPFAPDTSVEAVSRLSTGEEVTQSFLWNELGQYVPLSFDLCELEILNPCQSPIRIYRSGAECVSVSGGDSVTIGELLPGTELTIQLYETDVAEPVHYTCSGSCDHFTADAFALTDAQRTALNQAATGYINNAINIYNYRDIGSLEKLVPTELSKTLLSDLKEEMAYTIEKDGYTYIFRMAPQEPQLENITLGMHPDPTPLVDVSYRIPFDFTEEYGYQSGEIERSTGSGAIQDSFLMRYHNEAWEVAG